MAITRLIVTSGAGRFARGDGNVDQRSHAIKTWRFQQQAWRGLHRTSSDIARALPSFRVGRPAPCRVPSSSNHAQILMLAGITLCKLIRLVHASIFDDQHFCFIILLAKKSKDLFQSGGQAFFLVMSWDDDG